MLEVCSRFLRCIFDGYEVSKVCSRGFKVAPSCLRNARGG
jgi:hypothetical protein